MSGLSVTYYAYNRVLAKHRFRASSLDTSSFASPHYSEEATAKDFEIPSHIPRTASPSVLLAAKDQPQVVLKRPSPKAKQTTNVRTTRPRPHSHHVRLRSSDKPLPPHRPLPPKTPNRIKRADNSWIKQASMRSLPPILKEESETFTENMKLFKPRPPPPKSARKLRGNQSSDVRKRTQSFSHSHNRKPKPPRRDGKHKKNLSTLSKLLPAHFMHSSVNRYGSGNDSNSNIWDSRISVTSDTPEPPEIPFDYPSPPSNKPPPPLLKGKTLPNRIHKQ